MKTAELLREIADVMEENPIDGYTEFEHHHFSSLGWLPYSKWEHLINDAARCPDLIRRRPRTIKVGGEVPEDMVTKARRVFDNPHGSADSYFLARTILELIEPSEEK